MSMTKKMSLVALAVCVVSTAAHAEDKSWGTATASVKINAMQEWGITKVKDGNLYLNKNGTLSGVGPNRSKPEFRVVNNSATASKYYIAGAGASHTDNGDIMVVNDDDATIKYKVKPYDLSGNKFVWDSTAIKFRSVAEVAAGESQDFRLSTSTSLPSHSVPPGNYTVSVELFVPTA